MAEKIQKHGPGEEATVSAASPRPRKRRRWLVIGLIVLVVIAVAVGADKIIRHNNPHSNTAFVINGKTYPKSQISDMVAFVLQKSATPTAAHRQSVAKNIFGMYKTEIAAQQAKITPDAAELQAAVQQAALPAAKTTAAKAYNSLVVFNAALQPAYVRYESSDDDGYSFVFNFSEKILPTTPQKPSVPGHGNQTLIAQDKAYANKQAQKYYTELKDKQITPDKLLAVIAADPRLNFSSPSVHFSSSAGGRLSTQIYFGDVYNYVAVQTGPGLSGIRTGKVPNKWQQPTSGYVPGYYYFVQMNKASPIIQNPTGNVAAQEAKLQAAYYGI